MPLNGRTGLALTSIAALLLLVSGARARAEEEPAARAPLPPPLQNVPAEVGEPRRSTGTADGAQRTQSHSGPPTIRFGRPPPLQKKPSLTANPHHGAAVAARRRPPGASRQQDRHAVALGTRQGRDRLPIGSRIGQLSPPTNDTARRIESTMSSQAVPPRAQPSYHPYYFAGPPAYGYAPSYPFTWAPPGPGVFR
jgi:hypothetical protein